MSTVLSVDPDKRLLSLDIYRGMTMLAMMLHTFGLKRLADLPVTSTIYRQLNHADWVGFHFEDFILPSFLFIMGFSLALSSERRMENGAGKGELYLQVFKRSAVLFLFGFFLSWYEAGRMITGPGVLQLLALSYFIAALFSGLSIRGRVIVFWVLVLLHWFFIAVIPVYDVGRNSYVIYKNLVYLIDETLTNSPSRWGYIYTLLTSSAVVVFGSIAGSTYRRRESDGAFMKFLAVSGGLLVFVGLMQQPLNPIIKRMFTTSYTLLTCGMASLVLLALYYIADIRRIRGWELVFVVVGMNSIFIYIVHNLLRFWLLDSLGIFIDPLESAVGAWVDPLKHGLALAAQWLLCYWLYKQRIFFRL